ncbi:MAG: hypothetical protein LBV03_04635, partial [Fusobacteriales bacterium]|nr:hypothetical protein [Fusobacteriales bacterium]
MRKIKIISIIIIFLLIFFCGRKTFLVILIKKKINKKIFVTSSNFWGLKKDNGIFILNKKKKKKVTDETVTGVIDYKIKEKILTYIICEDKRFYLVSYDLNLNNKKKQYINLESINDRREPTIYKMEPFISYPVIDKNFLFFIFDNKIYKYDLEQNKLLFLVGDIKDNNSFLLNND